MSDNERRNPVGPYAELDGLLGHLNKKLQRQREQVARTERTLDSLSRLVIMPGNSLEAPATPENVPARGRNRNR